MIGDVCEAEGRRKGIHPHNQIWLGNNFWNYEKLLCIFLAIIFDDLIVLRIAPFYTPEVII